MTGHLRARSSRWDDYFALIIADIKRRAGCEEREEIIGGGAPYYKENGETDGEFGVDRGVQYDLSEISEQKEEQHSPHQYTCLIEPVHILFLSNIFGVGGVAARLLQPRIY